MSKRAIISILAAFFVMQGGNAQESSESKGMKVTSFNTHFGVNGVYSVVTNSDYLLMKQNVEDATRFIDDVNSYLLDNQSGLGGGFSPEISIGLTPYSKKLGALNYNREFRISIGANFGGRRSFFYSREERFAYDTLKSSVGNPDIIIDSIQYNYPSYVETIYELKIGLSYLFKTDASKRWYLYTGVGVEYGFALQDFITISNDSGFYYTNNPETQNQNQWYLSGGPQTYFTNSTKANVTSSTHFARMYIPLGVNFRISNNNDFFKHLNLYMHFTPGLELQMVSNVKTYANPYFGMALIGVKYTIN